MHNSGILERQYWANPKNKELRKHERKNINKEAARNYQTQLEIPGRNEGGEEKYRQLSGEKSGKT